MKLYVHVYFYMSGIEQQNSKTYFPQTEERLSNSHQKIYIRYTIEMTTPAFIIETSP